MDEVTNLLESLARLGVKLAADDGQLRISAAKGVLTEELRQRLQASKGEILRRLQGSGPAGHETGAADRIASDPEGDRRPFPLSDLQLGFYIANDPYMEFHVRPHYYMELDRDGLDVPAYEAAWNRVLRRRRRELCRVNADVELELLEEVPAVACRVYDHRGLPAAEARDALLEVRREMMREELRLDAWPWLDLRVSLWREEGRDRARIHYNHNNFFADGFSANQLLAEVNACYRDPELALPPPLELSYRDAVLGLERLAGSAAGQAARDYWFSRLPGLPPPPPLPQKAGLDRRCRSRLTRRSGTLDRGRWEIFKGRASALGLTPSSAVIAAYARVIATWSDTDRFILSQMVTRRFGELHPDLTRMLGNFASLYPLEVRLGPGATFVEDARAIQERVLEDLQHLQLGGMRVLQELNRLKGAFGTAPSPFVVGSGLFIKKYRKADFAVLETSQTVLDHQFFELEDGSYFYVWDLLEELFPEGMIEAMWAAFQGLLHRLVDDAGAWSRRDFDLVVEADLRERAERNRTGRPVPGGALHDPLREQAAVRGGAVVLAAGSRAPLRYGELAAWSDALAADLAARGVGRGDLVPVVMDRGLELMAAVFAVLKAGAAYVPVDPRLPAERLAFLLADVRAGIALTQPLYAASLAWPAGVEAVAVAPEPLAAPVIAVAAGADGTDLAYVIYTSGSTGRPKGVMIDHRGAWNTVHDVNGRFGVGAADVLFGVSAFSFDLSVYDLFGAVAAGARLVYPEPGSALDPAHWLDLALAEGVTVWSSVPALMSLLVEAAQRRGVRLPALRLAMLSGDKIPLDLPDAVRRVAPNAEVVSLGGATEASIWSILFPVGEVDPDWATIPYGYPMVNQTWEVLDRNGRPCPTWVPGELCIGGVGLAKGYWNDPGKTARSFGADPRTGERLYRTGDLGRYLPGGCIEWMGRIDFQVKVQGHRIELGEIEAALAEHPAVRQAVAAVHESPGTRQRRLVAYVVPADGAAPEARDLESFLRAKLPAHMAPTAWRTLERLPLTGNGKVDRQALSRVPIEEEAAVAARRETVPPDGPVEARLLAIWERILGASGLGVTGDFFELGGQSFDAIRIFALIKEELGTAYTLSDMWRARTVRELAKGIGRQEAGAGGGGGGRVVAIDLRGRGEPLFLVHPAGGSVMGYSRLGRLLDRPLYGIEAAAGPDERRRDVVALARGYVAGMRRVQERGPYSLGGWSSGAMVAFEMAAQLEAAGEEVRQVFLLDGPAPFDHGEVDDERLLRWFVEDLALGLPVDRLRGLPLAELAPAEQLREASRALQAEIDLAQLLPNFEVFRDLIAAGSRYAPRPVAADLTVVRVERDVVDEFAAHPHRHDADWGWRGLTRGQVRCARVPGTHHTFLGEPLVDGWCSLLCETEPAAVGRT